MQIWNQPRSGFMNAYRTPAEQESARPVEPLPAIPETKFSWVRVITCLISVVALVNMAVKVSNEDWPAAMFYLAVSALAIAGFAIAELRK